jgi:hypothetical protein
MSKSAFLNAVEAYLLTRRYSLRTIKTYQYWIKSFIIYHHIYVATILMSLVLIAR